MVFYCNPCWAAFTQHVHQAQHAQPQSQSQQRTATTSQSAQQQPHASSTNKKPQKKKKKSTTTATSTANKTATQSKQQATKITKLGPSSLTNRPSLFDDADQQAQSIQEGDEKTIADDDILQPNTYMLATKKPTTAAKPTTANKKPKSTSKRRPFVGGRVEPRATFERHQAQKRQLIQRRFGINDDDGEDDTLELPLEHALEDKDKKKKKKIQEQKPHINLVVIGHVDAGKSTLMGRLLYEYGLVNHKTMHKYRKESAQSGKSSFAYAWVLDCHEEERARGITVDVSTHYFETPHRCITLLDSPGHKDFIPAMISGASQSDAAILVVNAKTGDFETGFDANQGQTREHALIAKSLGVQQLIVAVNKMDACAWSEQRFDFIVHELKAFLKEIGFASSKKRANVVFIPVSGLNGDNLMDSDGDDKSAEKWWKQPVSSSSDNAYRTHKSLFTLIDELRPTSSILHDSLHGALRMTITDIYKEQNVGVLATGKVLSGSVMTHEQIVVQPLNLVSKVKSLVGVDHHRHAYQHQVAVKGDNIQLLLEVKEGGGSGGGGSDADVLERIKVGDIISSPHAPLQLSRAFECKIVTMKNLKIPICKGHHVMVHTQSVEKPAFIAKINCMLDKKTGQAASGSKHVRHIKADQCAVVTVKLQNKKDVILLDTYDELKELARVTLRRDGQTVALGLVQSLDDQTW